MVNNKSVKLLHWDQATGRITALRLLSSSYVGWIYGE